jgi:hypothetical protein
MREKLPGARWLVSQPTVRKRSAEVMARRLGEQSIIGVPPVFPNRAKDNRTSSGPGHRRSELFFKFV